MNYDIDFIRKYFEESGIQLRCICRSKMKQNEFLTREEVLRYTKGHESILYWNTVEQIKESLTYIEKMVDCVDIDLIRDMHDDVKKMKDKYIGEDIPLYQSHYVDKDGKNISEEEYLKQRNECQK